MDLSPYRNMEEPTQQGRNQRKVLTLSPTLFSNDVPWAKGATILFLSSIVPIRTRGLVRFVLLYYAILCLRSWSCWAKGSCIGAAVKGRFPPFHWRASYLPHHSGLLLIDRDFTDAEGSLLTKPPTWEASRQKEATRKRSCLRSFSPFSRKTRLVATLIQKVTDATFSAFRNRNHLSFRLLHP